MGHLLRIIIGLAATFNGALASEGLRRSPDKIVGGSEASEGEYPFMVHGHGPGCGATLVAKDMVLSAGHCEGRIWLPNFVALR